MNIQDLVRSNIKKLKPYSSARDEFKGGINDMVFLDANENPFNTGLNRYPDPQQSTLKALLSKQKGVAITNILLGNGSDEVLDLIIRAFCEPNIDHIITLPPTYGMYQVLADINGVDVVQIQLTETFEPNVEKILELANSKTKVLFLCSPNNPTANSFNAEKVEKLIQNFKGIVVIDEAYIQFSTKESWINRLKEFPNLIVTQTLSKAYGLAGIRLGICMASTEIIKVLNTIKPPYNVNQLTQDKAIEKLSLIDIVNKDVGSLVYERNLFKESLKSISLVKHVYPSDANFLLVKVDDANRRYKQILEKGIVVRNRHHEPLCENCLRFTVGNKKEMVSLLEVLNKLED